MIIEWNESLSSGIEEVDAQHRELIKLLRRLQILHENGSSKDFKLRILRELSTYAEYHFISEENLMTVTRYPMIEQHQFEHKKLLRALKFRIDAFADGDESLGSLIDFLATWVDAHTRDEDGKIGVYLNSAGAQGGAQGEPTP